MVNHVAYLAAGRGSGRALYLLFQWLWTELHWWAAPVYAAFTALGGWGLWHRRDGR